MRALTRPESKLLRVLIYCTPLVILLLVLEVVALIIEPPLEWEFKVNDKKPGVYRIFVFGGSTTYGTPVPKFGYVAQLQFLLQKIIPNTDIEVMNFGVGGKSIQHPSRRSYYGYSR